MNARKLTGKRNCKTTGAQFESPRQTLQIPPDSTASLGKIERRVGFDDQMIAETLYPTLPPLAITYCLKQ